MLISRNSSDQISSASTSGIITQVFNSEEQNLLHQYHQWRQQQHWQPAYDRSSSVTTPPPILARTASSPTAWTTLHSRDVGSESWSKTWQMSSPNHKDTIQASKSQHCRLQHTYRLEALTLTPTCHPPRHPHHHINGVVQCGYSHTREHQLQSQLIWKELIGHSSREA